jgi:hypothetical protein
MVGPLRIWRRMPSDLVEEGDTSKMRNRIKVLYVAGWGRSGSTILTNILGQVDGFVSVGEVNFLWQHGLIENRLCGCGAPFRECEEWTEILDRAFGGADSVDPHRMVRLQNAGVRTRHVPLMLTPWGRRRLESRLGGYLGTLGRLYGAVRDVTGSSVIVDSSKFPSYGYALGMAPGVELYVLHLVRDPRAVAYSWLKRKVQPDLEGTRYMMQRSPAGSSLRWMARNLATEAFWRRSPGRYMMLRYEDFVAEPREALGRVLDLLGEKASLSHVEDHEVKLGVNHNIWGNPSRFRSGRVEIRPDTEWASRINPGDRSLITALTLPLLVRYGYPLSAGGPGP